MLRGLKESHDKEACSCIQRSAYTQIVSPSLSIKAQMPLQKEILREVWTSDIFNDDSASLWTTSEAPPALNPNLLMDLTFLLIGT
ncbi:hypothetical protein GN956_G20061 [Arapaima gigas]